MTGEDWSREEVEATVADYFDMLDKELRGENYSKTKHRRHLSKLLNGRSDGAIERKHQNISAVLISLGFPYIMGYKPLRNYQRLLYEIVSERLENSWGIVDLAKIQVELPSDVPTVDDILAAWVEPPVPIGREQYFVPIRELSPTYNRINYLEKETHNRSLGDAGEKFVVRYEIARLIKGKKERLAAKVEQISEKYGDGAGFDVLSFDEMGRERFIEVKTTTYGPLTPFFITKNELQASHEEGYYLYRNFNFRKGPKLFVKQGPLDKSFLLEPSQYVARIS